MSRKLQLSVRYFSAFIHQELLAPVLMPFNGNNGQRIHSPCWIECESHWKHGSKGNLFATLLSRSQSSRTSLQQTESNLKGKWQHLSSKFCSSGFACHGFHWIWWLMRIAWTSAGTVAITEPLWPPTTIFIMIICDYGIEVLVVITPQHWKLIINNTKYTVQS